MMLREIKSSTVEKSYALLEGNKGLNDQGGKIWKTFVWSLPQGGKGMLEHLWSLGIYIFSSIPHGCQYIEIETWSGGTYSAEAS